MEVEEHLLTLLIRQDNEQFAHVLLFILQLTILVFLDQVFVRLGEKPLDERFQGWIEECYVFQKYFVWSKVSDDFNLELNQLFKKEFVLYGLKFLFI